MVLWNGCTCVYWRRSAGEGMKLTPSHIFHPFWCWVSSYKSMDYINQSPPVSPTYSLIHSQVFIEYLLYVGYWVRHWGHNGGYDSMSALQKVVDE